MSEGGVNLSGACTVKKRGVQCLCRPEGKLNSVCCVFKFIMLKVLLCNVC